MQKTLQRLWRWLCRRPTRAAGDSGVGGRLPTDGGLNHKLSTQSLTLSNASLEPLPETPNPQAAAGCLRFCSSHHQHSGALIPVHLQ